MRKLLSVLLWLGMVLLITPGALADDSKAQEIVKEARAAVGGEELQKLQSLYISGKYRRVIGDREMGGEREVSMQLPDKYLVEDAMSMGGMSTAMMNARTLNGEHAWNTNSGGGGMMFRFGGPGGKEPSPEEMEAMFRRQFQREFTRYLLAIALMAPPSIAVEYKYVGDSDVDDAKVDVVEVSGPDKLAIRIYVDKQSHLPLLLSYRGPKPRMITVNRPAGAPRPSPEDIKKLGDEAKNGPPPEEVEFYIRLSEHKKVSGLMLPHKFTFLTENEVSEEFEISKYQVNPQFKSEKFEKH
jgi:hypothetical protein